MHSLQRRTSGNVMFMILIAVVLLAALTYAVTKSDSGGTAMTQERASVYSDQLASFGLDLKRATENMTRAGISETAISFAHPNLTGYGTPDTTPKNEVFNIAGGGVGYVAPAANVNDGSQWEFTGSSAAPGVGDDATPDLMVVFPHLAEPICRAYNKKAGYALETAIPTDTGDCVYDTTKRYNGTFPTSGINTMDAGTFRSPAPMACVACGSGVSTTYNAYYVLLER